MYNIQQELGKLRDLGQLEQQNGYKAAIKAINNVDYKVDSNYVIANNALPMNYIMYRPEEGNLVWWIRNANNTYTVYTFVSGDFISGFINAAEQLGRDFRDYVLAAPYSISNGSVIDYNIEGYDLLPYRSNNRISAPIGPFYIENIEDNDYNVDWE